MRVKMNLGDAASSQHGVNDSAGEPETLPSAASTAPVAAHHGGDSSQITAAGSGPSVQAGHEASVQVQPSEWNGSWGDPNAIRY